MRSESSMQSQGSAGCLGSRPPRSRTAVRANGWEICSPSPGTDAPRSQTARLSLLHTIYPLGPCDYNAVNATHMQIWKTFTRKTPEPTVSRKHQTGLKQNILGRSPVRNLNSPSQADCSWRGSLATPAACFGKYDNRLKHGSKEPICPALHPRPCPLPAHSCFLPSPRVGASLKQHCPRV